MKTCATQMATGFIACLALAGCKKTEAPEATSAAPAQGAVADQAAPPPAPAEPVFEGPGEKLPRAMGDWQISGAPRYFGPENLYDLINGGAEVYTAYGLKKMVTADYTSKAHPNITVSVEVYDMSTPLGAFGRFSRFLDGKARPGDAGKGLPDAVAPQGLFGGANASFWKGPFLVNLTLLDESPDATMEGIESAGAQILPAMTTAVFDRIDAADPPPEECALFPEAGRVERSCAYAPDDLLAVPGLGAGFTVRYAQGESAWTMFATAPLADEDRDAALATAQGVEGMTARSAGDRIIGFKPEPPESSPSAAAAHLEALLESVQPR